MGEDTLRHDPAQLAKRLQMPWWEAAQRQREWPPEDAPLKPAWVPEVRDLRRSDSEMVRATRWSCADEVVITLQWLRMGIDGDWQPANQPPKPPDF